MNNQIPVSDLLKACEILFNTNSATDINFFRTLDISTLKHAYRKKALETHPDRSKALGKNEDVMIKKFKEVTASYEILKPIAEKKTNQPPHYKKADNKTARNNENHGYNKSGNTEKEETRRSSFNDRPKSPPYARYDNHYYKGPLPKCELKLNKYLYYAGLIPWKIYINSIIWEKKQRPMFGQIAYQWNYLSLEDIRNILNQRIYPEKFGESALRNGYLSTFQHMAVLGKQRMLEPTPEKFFIENGCFTPEELESIISKQKAFNQSVSATNFF